MAHAITSINGKEFIRRLPAFCVAGSCGGNHSPINHSQINKNTPFFSCFSPPKLLYYWHNQELEEKNEAKSSKSRT